MVINAIFSNIFAISWQPVLVVEEAGVPEAEMQLFRGRSSNIFHIW